MELLERYLQAVRRHLKWKKQDDILAELRGNLESQLEDKEAALGRPLTDAEMEAWLKQLGPPMQMAARYQQAQYLIGPAVFPTYRYVVRLALTWSFVVYGIVSAVQIVTRTPDAVSVAGALVRLPWVLMVTAGWVTLVFAAIEFSATRNPEWFPAFASSAMGWSPAGLPPLERTDGSGGARRSRAHAIAEVVFGFLLLIWLLLFPAHPYLLLGPGAFYLGALPYKLAPVCWEFYWWIVGLNALQLGWHAFDLGRGKWQRPEPVQHLVFKAVGLIPLVLVLAAPGGALVVLKNPGVDQPYNGVPAGVSLGSLNHDIRIGVLVIVCIAGAQLAWDLGKMGVDAYRKRVAR
jgi:hypothetical protein